MSLTANIKALLNYATGGSATRQLALPAGAAISLTANGAGSTYGAWADVVAAPTAKTLVVGLFLSAPSAADVYTVQLGSAAGYVNAAGVNGGGAPVIAAATTSAASIGSSACTRTKNRTSAATTGTA